MALHRVLGTAAVQGIVEAHGGAVAVTSAPGEGTTVDVYFPLVTADPQDGGSAAQA